MPRIFDNKDAKLHALEALLMDEHSDRKIAVSHVRAAQALCGKRQRHVVSIRIRCGAPLKTRYPLRQTAVDTLNRQLRSSISDEALAQLVIALRDDDGLCIRHKEDERQESRIICSLGLIRSC